MLRVVACGVACRPTVHFLASCLARQVEGQATLAIGDHLVLSLHLLVQLSRNVDLLVHLHQVLLLCHAQVVL